MLRSMTGFGQSEGDAFGLRWSWELRSVNGKGLDIRLRLPSGYERLEQAAKKQVSAQLSRGNLQVSLTFERGSGTANVVLNETVLNTVLSAVAKIEASSNLGPSSAADILAIRGVLESGDDQRDADEQAELDRALLDSMQCAVSALRTNREREGQVLNDLLSGNLDQMDRLVERAEADPSRTSEAIGARLKEQLDRVQSAIEPDADRVAQELALLATKADIREELDRLNAHISAAREHLAAGSPTGRKLDFLAQEFNRECNTLCSKSNAVSLTEIGLEMKVVVDQFREQCLNVE